MMTAAAGAAAVAAPNDKLVLVTVVAGDAKPATGLAPADFTVTEDKDTLQVTEAVPATDPLSIVLVVDTSAPAGMAAPTAELRRALTAFVSTVHATEPSARVAIYQVANAATPLADFTSERPALEKAIGLVASGNASGSAMLEGVATAARRLGDVPPPRRAIVCVGMGTAEGSSYQPDDVGKRVRAVGATLWVVSVQGMNDQALTSRDTLWTRATADTGGTRQNVVQATRLDSSLKSVANSLVSQYTLKIARKKDGAVKGFKGQTAAGLPVLFTRWMR
jgi:hypothetical protein